MKAAHVRGVEGLAVALVLGSFLVFTACGSSNSDSASNDGTGANAGDDDDDGGGDDDAAYMGETSNGNAPNAPLANPDPVFVDGGPFTVDTTCCPTTFSIPNDQPASTTGVLYGNSAPLDADAGIPVALASGVWSVVACVPVNSTVRYWYEFTVPPAMATAVDAGMDAGADASDASDAAGDAATDAGDDDASSGTAGDDDASTGPTVVREYNPNEPNTSDGAGHTDNVLEPVTTCAGSDGG